MSGRRKATAPTLIATGGVPRVNLLPAEIIQKRLQRKLFGSWATRVLFSIVVLAGVAGLMCLLSW